MSLDASRWAWSQRVAKSSTKLVLLALADRAGADDASYPSIETISNDTELNRKTILAAMKELISLGLIEDSGARKGQSGRVIVYRLLGISHRDDKQKKVPKKGQSQKGDDPKKGIVPKEDSNSTENGTSNSTENGTQNLPVEPISEQSLKRGEYPQWFEQLWKRYPQRIGSNEKKKAAQAINARIREGRTLKELSDAVERYLVFTIANESFGTQYVMQAARFFGPGDNIDNPWPPTRPRSPTPTPASTKPRSLIDEYNAQQERPNGQ